MSEKAYLQIEGFKGAAKYSTHLHWTVVDHAAIISGDPDYRVSGAAGYTTKAGPVEGFRFSITAVQVSRERARRAVKYGQSTGKSSRRKNWLVGRERYIAGLCCPDWR
jgi:hypothetical protein